LELTANLEKAGYHILASSAETKTKRSQVGIDQHRPA
jgi:hypothetical protein